MKKLLLLLFVLLYFSSFSQIYKVGNEDGFSFSCYAQSNNSSLSINKVGYDDGVAYDCYSQSNNTMLLINTVGCSGGSAFSCDGSSNNITGPFVSCSFIIVLPIELLYFEAKCKTERNNNKVEISWGTATQINNDYFTIERSGNGINFNTIGTVDGAGNSAQPINYFFVDSEPLKEISYYRLKQTDFNGTSKYFNLVSVSCDAPTSSTINIYPNPTNGYFTIEGAEVNTQLIIVNALGQQITNQKISSYKTDIDLSHLSNGIYFIQINSEKKNITQKIILNKLQ